MNNLSGDSDKVQFLRHCCSVAMEIHFIMHLLEPGSVILLMPKQAVCILKPIRRLGANINFKPHSDVFQSTAITFDHLVRNLHK